MNNFSTLLKPEEKAVFELRELYSNYGYLPYKMSKFEEYDFYVKNKDFLVSDRIITFNDTNGKLLALKPDVTLSIVKNAGDEKGCTQKLFYNENVYRVSGSTHAYKEIMQAGIECIGDVGTFDIAQVLTLALKSLDKFSESFVLDVSHMGVIAAVLEEAGCDEDFNKKIMHYIGEKNCHEIKALCEEYCVDEPTAEKISSLVEIYGKGETVFPLLKKLSQSEKMKKAVSELEEICLAVEASPLKEKINLDFSIVNDLSYYNGVVFKGYISSIPESVLSGGQYDRLMKKLGKKSGAIGFAIYLDLLEQLSYERREFDVDVLLLYAEDCNKKLLFEKAEELVKEGKSVSAQKAIPQKLRYKEIVEFN